MKEGKQPAFRSHQTKTIYNNVRQSYDHMRGNLAFGTNAKKPTNKTIHNQEQVKNVKKQI